MAIATTTLLDIYLNTARQVGCPPDQLRYFRLGEYCAQPKQLRFHAMARLADLPGGPTQLGFGGARGPGKSTAAIAQVALDDCQRMPGLKALFLRSIGASARESFEDLLTKVLGVYRHLYVPSKARIEFANGSQFQFGGFRTEGDIGKYVGIEYDVLCIEEANLLPQDRVDQLRGSVRTSKQNWRPRTYLTFNPGGIGHAWIKRRFIEPWRRDEQADTAFVFSTVDDNAFVNPEYVAYLDSLTGWLKSAWRYGDWDIAAGQYFTTWHADAHVVEPFNIPTSWHVWLAMDYGFVHPNVVHLLAESGEGEVYIVGEHAQQRWLVPRHARAVRAMLDRCGIGEKRVNVFLAGADIFAERGTVGGTIADQWKAEGFPLTVANDDRLMGAAEWLRRLGDVDAGMAPTVRIFSTCARLIECLPALEHDPHRPEDVLKWNADSEGKGGDDSYDSSRYGLMHVARRDTGRVYAIPY